MYGLHTFSFYVFRRNHVDHLSKMHIHRKADTSRGFPHSADVVCVYSSNCFRREVEEKYLVK